MENYRCGSKASDFLLSFSGLDVYSAYQDSLVTMKEQKMKYYIIIITVSIILSSCNAQSNCEKSKLMTQQGYEIQQKGNNKEAIMKFEEAIGLCPDNQNAYYNFCLLYTSPSPRDRG